jgi:hypothetical protein
MPKTELKSLLEMLGNIMHKADESTTKGEVKNTLKKEGQHHGLKVLLNVAVTTSNQFSTAV